MYRLTARETRKLTAKEKIMPEHPDRFEDEERALLSWILSINKETPQVSDDNRDVRLEEEESR